MKTVLLNKVNGAEKYEIEVIEDTQFVISNFPDAQDFGNTNCDEDISINLVFRKPFLRAEVLGIFDMDTGKGIKVFSSSKHLVEGTSCVTFMKAVLHDSSSFDYEGRIKIEKAGKNTSAFLHDNVLVSGEKTKRNSKPVLEIEANDVKASHGSTTGRLDENQVYYLTSRGLSRHDAEALIEEGFLMDLAVKIYDRKIRENLVNRLKSKRN